MGDKDNILLTILYIMPMICILIELIAGVCYLNRLYRLREAQKVMNDEKNEEVEGRKNEEIEGREEEIDIVTKIEVDVEVDAEQETLEISKRTNFLFAIPVCITWSV